MKALRRTVVGGLAGLGLIGALATGVGIASATTPSPAPNGGAGLGNGRHAPMGGMMGLMGGMMPGHAVPITAAATYLGMSQEDLRTQLANGTSLADIAKARGKSVSGLQDAIVAAMTSGINADTTLSPAQKAAMLTMVKNHVATMVTTGRAAGAGCPMKGTTGRGGAGTMMGGTGPRAMMGTGVA